MTIGHHLDNATLLQYASGELDEAFIIVVAAHIAMCDACRQAAHGAEEIGGGLLADSDTADLSAGAFEQLMQKLDQDPSEQASATRPQKMDAASDVPAPLVRHIGPRLDAIRWKTVAPGVRKHDIKKASPAGSSLYLLHIAPGMAVPEHGHGGAELTLVLSGTYSDAFGAFSRGDIADLDEYVEHQPFVEGEIPCICLVATEAPTRFKGIINRLFQPFIGI